jgi:uncharacterized membrane protein
LSGCYAFNSDVSVLLRENILASISSFNQLIYLLTWEREKKKREELYFVCTLGLVWMRMYSFQSTCVKVDWNEIKLNFISFHSNTRGLRWIHMHTNKTVGCSSGLLLS